MNQRKVYICAPPTSSYRKLEPHEEQNHLVSIPRVLKYLPSLHSRVVATRNMALHGSSIDMRHNDVISSHMFVLIYTIAR